MVFEKRHYKAMMAELVKLSSEERKCVLKFSLRLLKKDNILFNEEEFIQYYNDLMRERYGVEFT
jgi:hypothetical protein